MACPKQCCLCGQDTPFNPEKRNDGSFKKWIVKCGFEAAVVSCARAGSICRFWVRPGMLEFGLYVLHEKGLTCVSASQWRGLHPDLASTSAGDVGGRPFLFQASASIRDDFFIVVSLRVALVRGRERKRERERDFCIAGEASPWLGFRSC